MGIITYTRKAKCKDCRFCKSFFRIDYKRTSKKCVFGKQNEIPTEQDKTIRLNDFVCENWKL